MNKEIENAEEEIKTLKLSSIEYINKIAIETSSEVIRKIVGTEVNASSVSATVEDISKKEIDKIYMTIDATFWVAIAFVIFIAGTSLYKSSSKNQFLVKYYDRGY